MVNIIHFHNLTPHFLQLKIPQIFPPFASARRRSANFLEEMDGTGDTDGCINPKHPMTGTSMVKCVLDLSCLQSLLGYIYQYVFFFLWYMCSTYFSMMVEKGKMELQTHGVFLLSRWGGSTNRSYRKVVVVVVVVVVLVVVLVFVIVIFVLLVVVLFVVVVLVAVIVFVVLVVVFLVDVSR